MYTAIIILHKMDPLNPVTVKLKQASTFSTATQFRIPFRCGCLPPYIFFLSRGATSLSMILSSMEGFLSQAVLRVYRIFVTDRKDKLENNQIIIIIITSSSS